MAARSPGSYTGSIPEYYDRYLVPLHFEPFAKDLAGRAADARPRGAVLEVACGTGIVTGQLRARLPSSTRIVATDLNQAMLDYARAKLADAAIDWQKADATQLPFEASSFGAAVCGFGVMFVPDKSVMFRETRRVLAPGATFIFNVWDGLEANECSRIVNETISVFLGGREPEFMRVPFGFNDRGLIGRLLAGGGFDRIEIEPVTVETGSPSARNYALGVIKGTPAGHELQQGGISLDDVVEAAAAALARNLGDNPCRLDRRALVVAARAA
jgi:SAM-dependent methyltransferase